MLGLFPSEPERNYLPNTPLILGGREKGPSAVSPRVSKNPSATSERIQVMNPINIIQPVVTKSCSRFLVEFIFCTDFFRQGLVIRARAT